MDWNEFRRNGHALVDWIADYYARVDSMPVLSQVAPGEVRAQLPAEPPQQGESFDAMMADMERVIMPGITHWQSPNFFAFFPANTSSPSILGELLSAGLGVQGMLWATSPACTELETHMLDWVARMMGLPGHFLSAGEGGGVIQDSASSATLCALLAARERATGLESNRRGLQESLCVYTSVQGHSSIEKAVKIAGLGREALRLIDVDAAFAMQPAALEAAIEADLQAGRTPCLVVATIGTTSSLAIDPIPQIGKICRRHAIWLHVDGAMAGNAAVCPEFREMQAGLELADSYCFNMHKWLLTNFDCTCFYVACRRDLVNALSVLPEYLRNQATESGAVIDYRDWQIPLGRRFRALKLWFVIRHYGIAGLQAIIRRHVGLAQEFAEWVRADEAFDLVGTPSLNLVCFRHRADDAFNERLVDRVNQSGMLYVTHTRLNEDYIIRFCVGQAATERMHVESAWSHIRIASKNLQHELDSG